MSTVIDPNSVVFLMAESRNQPMHVGGLQLFEAPPDAAPGFIRAAYERALATDPVSPLFLRRPQRLIPGVGPWTWGVDADIDLEHHVRHSALPQPGRIRELLALVSRLHSVVLSRDRPLWETHVIEGLADGRFAIYTKLHHSLVDGISAMKLLQRSLSPDPDERDMPFPFEARSRHPTLGSGTPTPAATPDLVRAARSGLAMTAEAAGLPAAVLRTLNRSARGEAAAISLGAPRSPFNVPITGARRFAADSWSLERLRAIAAASGTTLNDVVLAMCGGALRHYLLDLGALPDASLVSMVPVGLPARSAASVARHGGNAVGSVIVKLATDTDDPAERLASISASMRSSKEALGAMSPMQILAMSAIGMAPALALPALGLDRFVPPPFNLVISNVPGADAPQYFNGARMTDIYPVSIPFRGNALNITCNSYADAMGFGLIGCRRAVPSLQRILTHLDQEVKALENAAGLS